MTRSIIVGIDGGLASVGWAALDVDASAIVAAGTFHTKRETRKRGLHSGSDDGRRIDELHDRLLDVLAEHAPFAIGYELPAGARGARAGHALGLAHALVRCAARHHDPHVPLVECTVLDCRRAAAERFEGRVSEDEAHAAIRARLHVDGPHSPHALDAMAVACATAAAPIVVALRHAAAARRVAVTLASGAA